METQTAKINRMRQTVVSQPCVFCTFMNGLMSEWVNKCVKSCVTEGNDDAGVIFVRIKKARRDKIHPTDNNCLWSQSIT